MKRRTEPDPKQAPVPLADDVKAWEQQPRETVRAYAAFVAYRDLPPDDRTIRAAAEKHNKSASQMANWSRRWQWRKRVRAYDLHLDLLVRKDNELRAKEAKERHLNLAKLMQAVGGKALRHALDRLDHPDAYKTLTLNEARLLVASGAQLEREILAPVDIDSEGEAADTVDFAPSGPIEIEVIDPAGLLTNGG